MSSYEEKNSYSCYNQLLFYLNLYLKKIFFFGKMLCDKIVKMFCYGVSRELNGTDFGFLVVFKTELSNNND